METDVTTYIKPMCHIQDSHEQWYGGYNNYQPGYRQYDGRQDQMQQDRGRREHYQMRARGLGVKMETTQDLMKEINTHKSDPFLE